jgi:hypothetical protein
VGVVLNEAAIRYARLQSRHKYIAKMNKEPHERAIEAALANDWDKAHEIVQVMNDPWACWIHAILHKIEGDVSNSRYWYGRSRGRKYEDFSDTRAELQAALTALSDAGSEPR